ncbi:hypothetical protein FACS189485_19560 [Spirochaetia bacterium]|nr:hypothetical protein FACS189485_19560 [Spirochaetia bacterium]
MKKFTLFSVFLFVSILAMAEIADIPFVPEEFDVDILQYPHMVLMDNPSSEQLDTHYTFTDKASSYQIRYTFFKQTVPDRKDIKMAYVMCILPVIFNVAGYETDQVANFNDSDVKNEFNGDFGSTVFIMDPKSDFGKGYKYIMLDFFYKNNQGIVVRSMLFNDLNFVQGKYFLEIYHSFKFHE